MIHHWSFNADNPPKVAEFVAEVTGGVVIKPPVPPYEPTDLWVCMFDEGGTMIEVGAKDHCKYPNEDGIAAIKELPGSTQQYSYNHALVTSAVSFAHIVKMCDQEGWLTAYFDGPFKFQGVWLENRQYIEFADESVLKYYTDIFGSSARETLDAHNRRREQELRQIAAEQQQAVK